MSNDAKTEDRYYVCRLLPPRPTFMQDMTPEEMALMGQHAAYWRGLLERGNAIVFGPVGGPKGGWGLAVARAASDDAMNALRDGDPVIQANRGFSYEILPMLRAVFREP